MRSRSWAMSFGVLFLISALFVACGSPEATPEPTSPPQQGETPEPSDTPLFDELVERARAVDDPRIRIGLEGVDAELIRAYEDAFEEQFGIAVQLESEPGHASRDIPVKVQSGAENDRGVVDFVFGGTNLWLTLLRDGFLQEPQWDAIYEGWPLARTLREAMPPIGGGPNETMMSDYCMEEGMSAWVLVYNTLEVDPSELEGLQLEDLTEEQWRNRVGWDARALGLYVLPFAPGWDVDRMERFAHNLGANGVKLIPGGSTGLIAAVIQGEADIVLASGPTALENKAQGAPIELAFPEFVTGTYRSTCIVDPTVNNTDLVNLFWAWFNFEGRYLEADLTGGGAFRVYPEEEGRFPLPDMATEAGLGPDDLVFPGTEEELEYTAETRNIAIQALEAGIQSGERIE